MADIYGQIVVYCDFTGNKTEVVKGLNKYLWNEDLEPFHWDGKSTISMDEYIQSPTIFPSKKTVFDEEGDTVDLDDPAFDSTISEGWDIEQGETADLGELVNAIAPLLESGEIVIAMYSTMRSPSIGSGELIIRADGTGTRQYRSTSSDFGSSEDIYQYP